MSVHPASLRRLLGMLVAGLVTGAHASETSPSVAEGPDLNAAVQVWRVDSHRSRADFQILALAMIPIRGQFSDLAGSVSLGMDLDAVTVVVPMSGLRMRSPEKRRWALSDAFFDAPKFPEIQFEAVLARTSTLAALQAGQRIEGQLSMHGQTASQSFALTRSTCDLTEPKPCDLDLEAEIDRTRYGLNRHSFTLADTVSMKITLYLEPLMP